MLTSSSDNPVTDPLLERIRSARPLDLMLLPFEPGIVTADHFEEALITLYKNRWRFPKLRWMYYALLVPALELTFLPLPNRLTAGVLFKRTVFFWSAVTGFVWLLHEGLEGGGYSSLFPLFSGVFAAGLVITHLLIAKSGFAGWQEAYRRIDRATLNRHIPPKPKRRKKLGKKIREAAPPAQSPETKDDGVKEADKKPSRPVPKKGARAPANSTSRAKS